jgi:mono/diheme cytochrome c family protein
LHRLVTLTRRFAPTSPRGRGTALCFLLLVCLSPPAAAQSPPKTVLDGVYSEAQAARGHDFFVTVCSSCHGEMLDGVSAPPLKGSRFIERWREGTIDGLFDFIRERMPFGRPANAKTMPDNEYLDILTYMLKVEGYRSGASELTSSQLVSVMLVGMDGPRPVPDGSHVVTVGCLLPASDGVWTVSSATEPVRTRQEDAPNPSELKNSAERKLGTQTFRLSDLEAVPDFSPSAHSGQKMQVKGFLVRQPNAERISLTSIGMIDSRCAP